MARTQAERSAATQALLLDATIGALVELGYPGASNVEICRRAGVSRGALLHHYPHKVALMAAAVEHLFERRLQELTLLARGTPREQLTRATLARLWELHQAPTAMAWLELVMAARRDEELRRALADVSGRLDQAAAQTLAELFELPRGTPVRGVVRLLLGLFDGMRLHHCLCPDDSADAEALLVFRTLLYPWTDALGAR